MAETEIERQLEEMKNRIDEVKQPPFSTLNILGREKVERDWEAFLLYFLNSEKPHGFGTDILEAFLSAVARHDGTTISGPFHDLEQVKIQSQVPTGTGLVDILLYLEDEWYICIELKVASSETGKQTVRYANANKLGELVVSQHQGEQEYVYLAPEASSPPVSDDFVEMPWSHIVDHLHDVLLRGYGQYPTKSTAQLADYLDTIQRELNMDELSEISEETRLYAEYKDTINRIMNQFEEDRDRIFDAIRDAYFLESNCNRDNWEVSNRTNRYIKFYKPEWHGLDGGVNIEYEPHVKLAKDHPEIRLRLDIEHGDKEPIREEFLGRLEERGDLEYLKANDWEIIDGPYGFMAKSVPIDLDDPQKSILRAVRELNEYREIAEPHIDAIARES